MLRSVFVEVCKALGSIVGACWSSITLFISITTFCGSDGMLSYSDIIHGIFCGILLVLYNIVMDPNNVMFVRDLFEL